MSVSQRTQDTAGETYALDAMFDDEAYQAWLADQARWEEERDAELARWLAGAAGPPTISVLVPVFRPAPGLLEACVASVRGQLYPRWELCLCDDGSADPNLTALLRRFAAEDARIRVTALPENRGIAAATNAALDLAAGEVVAFLDQDDELHRHALAEVATAFAGDDEIDVVYTDEDKLDAGGRRSAPVLKPAWSPDFLLSVAYLTHLLAIRRELVEAAGGLRPEYDGSQDYDLMLRVTERSRRIAHVARILYHWRTVEGSAAGDATAKPWAYQAAERALAETLRRRGIAGSVARAEVPGFYHVRREVVRPLRVSVVVDLGDDVHLGSCLDSLAARGGWDDWHVLVVNRAGPETAAALRNRAVERVDGDVLLFLDPSAEGVSEGWLRALLEHAQRPEVGAVGARLVRPDGHLLHAGLAIGLRGAAGRVFEGCPPTWRGYFCFDHVVRNWSAVDGACLMVPRAVFEEAGGFDESIDEALAAADICLRLAERGRLVVYTPHAEVVVRSPRGARRPRENAPSSWAGMLERGDPLFHPALSLERAEMRLPMRAEREALPPHPAWACVAFT